MNKLYYLLEAFIDDPYKVLGVSPKSSRKTVDEKFIKAIKIAHPDAGGTHEKAAQINAAYDMIKKDLIDKKEAKKIAKTARKGFDLNKIVQIVSPNIDLNHEPIDSKEKEELAAKAKAKLKAERELEFALRTGFKSAEDMQSAKKVWGFVLPTKEQWKQTKEWGVHSQDEYWKEFEARKEGFSNYLEQQEAKKLGFQDKQSFEKYKQQAKEKSIPKVQQVKEKPIQPATPIPPPKVQQVKEKPIVKPSSNPIPNLSDKSKQKGFNDVSEFIEAEKKGFNNKKSFDFAKSKGFKSASELKSYYLKRGLAGAAILFGLGLISLAAYNSMQKKKKDQSKENSKK